jgi:hypothetical protein
VCTCDGSPNYSSKSVGRDNSGNGIDIHKVELTISITIVRWDHNDRRFGDFVVDERGIIA